MINETIILLMPFEDCSKHRLAKHVEVRLRRTTSFDRYYYEPLRRLFSRIMIYDFVKRMTEVGLKAVNEEVVALVRKERPKYVLWFPAGYEFQESTFEKIRQEGSIVIGWFGDDDTRFDDYSKWWIPYLDYCVTNTLEAMPKYRELGARVIHAIPGTGIAVERDWSNLSERYDVSFVGRLKSDRLQYIEELRLRNILVHAFGRGEDMEGFVPFEEMIDIFWTSKINLNFGGQFGVQQQIKGRIFEVCLAGGFLLTEYLPRIENYFEVGKEIVCFRNIDDLVDKINYYLSHDAERRAIARAGWERATSEHDSFHLLSRIFDEVEGDITTKSGEPKCYVVSSRTPWQMRRRFSDYYLPWVVALLLEDYKGLWKGDLSLSIIYNPLNIRAWVLYIFGYSPALVRRVLIRLSIRLYRASGKFLGRPCSRLMSRLGLRK